MDLANGLSLTPRADQSGRAGLSGRFNSMSIPRCERQVCYAVNTKLRPIIKAQELKDAMGQCVPTRL
jgi:hypothetical protein